MKLVFLLRVSTYSTSQSKPKNAMMLRNHPRTKKLSSALSTSNQENTPGWKNLHIACVSPNNLLTLTLFYLVITEESNFPDGSTTPEGD
jgi:hypothetical protein